MGRASTGRHAGARRAGAASSVARLPLVLARLALVSLGLGVVLVVGVGGYLGHLGVTPVLTGSMRPTYAPGDAVVTRMVPVTRIHPGMIVVFVPPGESAPFAHRVVAVTGTPGHPVVETKGDANPAPDAWRAALPGPSVRQVVAVVPKVGYLLVRLHDPRVRASLIGVLGLLATALMTSSTLRRPRPRAVATPSVPLAQS
jgi:signal peptidase I